MWDLGWDWIGTSALKASPGVSGCNLVGRILEQLSLGLPKVLSGRNKHVDLQTLKKKPLKAKPLQTLSVFGFGSIVFLVKNHKNTRAYGFQLSCKTRPWHSGKGVGGFWPRLSALRLLSRESDTSVQPPGFLLPSEGSSQQDTVPLLPCVCSVVLNN